MIEIPLTNDPEQTFNIVIGSNSYDFRVLLNSRSGVWSISISLEGETLISGAALLGGIDIFDQYDIPISNAYVVNLENPKEDPTQEGLGTSSKLFILTEEEINNG